MLLVVDEELSATCFGVKPRRKNGSLGHVSCDFAIVGATRRFRRTLHMLVPGQQPAGEMCVIQAAPRDRPFQSRPVLTEYDIPASSAMPYAAENGGATARSFF